MGLKLFDEMTSDSIGLWNTKGTPWYNSQSINIAELKKFKGAIRFCLVKNKYHTKGDGRPEYQLYIKSSASTREKMIGFSEEKAETVKQLQERITELEEQAGDMYTHDQVQYAINCAAEDGARGYGWGNNLVSDYL